MNSRQRAQLRGMANTLDTIFQVGKGGCSDALYAQVDDCLTARELIKMRVLDTSPLSSREAAELIAEKVGAEVVQVIGSKFVLYRANAEEPKIVLVK